jgi:hypothetical protein
MGQVDPNSGVYRLIKPKQSLPDWGDYIDILIHGMADHLPRLGVSLQLERTGPFVPPISFPGHVVVTDHVKRNLEQHLPSLNFRPTIKTRIVRLDWHTWDTTTSDPPIWPESGEPEDYILAEPHDPLLAEELGDLWELCPDVDREILDKNSTFQNSKYRGQHFVRATEYGWNFVSAELKAALEIVAPTWVSFADVSVRIFRWGSSV